MIGRTMIPATGPGNNRWALALGDGNRVHLGDAQRFECLIAYGWRWRSAATRALANLGLKPPAGERV